MVYKYIFLENKFSRKERYGEEQLVIVTVVIPYGKFKAGGSLCSPTILVLMIRKGKIWFLFPLS